MNKFDEIYQDLETIDRKMQRGDCLSPEEVKFYRAWVIPDYLPSPYNLGTIRIGGITFTSTSAKGKLSYFQPAQGKKDARFLFTPKDLKEIPEQNKQMKATLASMGTVFVCLPPRLTEFQRRAIAYQEFLFSYAAPYIIRNAWGKGMCKMPKVDNRKKPELNTYSEQWLKLHNICIWCRDLLSEDELQDIPRASDFLRLIIREHRQNLMTRCGASHNNQGDEETISKKAHVAELRAIADALSKGENPCDPKTEPQKSRLMNICLSRVDRAEVFRKNFWTPYLGSIRNWARMIEESSNILATGVSADGRIVHQRRGTGKTPSQPSVNRCKPCK